MTRCLTQQQIDVALWITLAASAMALVTAVVTFAVWAGPQERRRDRGGALLAVLAAGLIVFLAVHGQFWNIAALIPALGVGAWASVVLRRAPTEGTVGLRPTAFTRYGLLVVVVACVLAVAAAAVWVIPADLCV